VRRLGLSGLGAEDGDVHRGGESGQGSQVGEERVEGAPLRRQPHRSAQIPVAIAVPVTFPVAVVTGLTGGGEVGGELSNHILVRGAGGRDGGGVLLCGDAEV